MYKNKDIENSKKYIQRRNEIITYRLLLILGAAVEKIGFFLYAVNVSEANFPQLRAWSFAGLIITGALTIFSVIFIIYKNKRNINDSETVFHSKMLLAIAILFFLADFVIYLTYQKWVPLLIAAAITLTVFVYIYYLYQREFFYFSVFSALGGFLLYLTESYLMPSKLQLICKILLAVGAVFIIIFALVLKKGKGNLKGKKINLKILDKKSKYLPFYILSVFAAGFAATSFIYPINFLYLIFALVGYYVIVGIYFTVKII